MSVYRRLGPVIILLGVAVFLGGCALAASTPTPSPAPVSLILATQIAETTVMPGGNVSMAVKLLDAGLPVDLSVYVKYADGQQQLVQQHASDVAVTLQWKVPTSAASGTATFGLLANHGCDCDLFSVPQQSSVQGTFVVAGR